MRPFQLQCQNITYINLSCYIRALIFSKFFAQLLWSDSYFFLTKACGIKKVTLANSNNFHAWDNIYTWSSTFPTKRKTFRFYSWYTINSLSRMSMLSAYMIFYRTKDYTGVTAFINWPSLARARATRPTQSTKPTKPSMIQMCGNMWQPIVLPFLTIWEPKWIKMVFGST